MPSSSDAVATMSERSPAFEALLGVEAPSSRQASMMSSDALCAEPFRESEGHALDEAPRVHEHDRRAMLARQRRQAIVELGPLLVGRDSAELVLRHLDGEIDLATSACVDDARLRPRGPDEHPRRHLDRTYRGAEADALRLGPAAPDDQAIEPGQREREVRSAFVGAERVDFVHDHGAHPGEPPFDPTPR